MPERYRDELGAVPADVLLALGDAVSRFSVDDFWFSWSQNAEAGLFGAYCRPVVPLRLAALLFSEEVCYVIRSRRPGGRTVGRSGAGRLWGQL